MRKRTSQRKPWDEGTETIQDSNFIIEHIIVVVSWFFEKSLWKDLTFSFFLFPIMLRIL